MRTTLRILLADDHDIVRRGLKELLQERPGWTVCAEASNGREAVELAAEHRPQVAVLDLSMPELNGLEATRRIRQATPETEVLVFTMHDSEELVRNVLAAGARGYLLKSDAALQLVPAVESLAQRKPFFAGRISEVLLEGFLNPERHDGSRDSAERLTSREREIVQLLAEGNSNKEIARSLDLSIKTVETHRAAVMRKLDLHSLADLVRFAIRNQIVSP
jgi:DNA-binding NarL/FixJ family response regulator